MVLEDVKILLNIDMYDISKDDIINLYKRKAITIIRNYLGENTDTDIETLYLDAIVEFIIIMMNQRGNEGYKQRSEGSVSVTMESNDIPNTVKVLLPFPYISVPKAVDYV